MSQTTETVVPQKADPEALVALSPGGGPAVQAQLIAWCDHRLQQLAVERSDAAENYEIAHKAKWRSSPYLTAKRKAERQIDYYEKVKLALQEGYVVVPNFDAEIFAIRVNEGSRPPSQVVTQAAWTQPGSDLPFPQSKALPAGEGRNVSPNVYVQPGREFEDKDGRMSRHDKYVSEFDDELQFPVKLVKPVILSAAQRALALKLFDEVGVVTGAASVGSDPILVGRIKNPVRRGWVGPHFVTFFLGWWLDPKAI